MDRSEDFRFSRFSHTHKQTFRQLSEHGARGKQERGVQWAVVYSGRPTHVVMLPETALPPPHGYSLINMHICIYKVRVGYI